MKLMSKSTPTSQRIGEGNMVLAPGNDVKGLDEGEVGSKGKDED